MSFAKRVAEAYQFLLDDLNCANKNVIAALTLNALDDIEYYETIVDVIVQHTMKVSNLFRFFLFSLFDHFIRFHFWEQRKF